MGIDTYVGLHEDLTPYVDVATNACFLCLGFSLRRLGVITDEHLPGMKLLTFTICLPLLMTGVMWTSKVDSSVLVAGAASFICHALWVLLSLFMARWTNPSDRGWYLMTTTAGALAYVYPVLMRSERFGPAALPVAVMWELGGNIQVAVLFHGMVAEMYSPNRREQGLTAKSAPEPQVIGVLCETNATSLDVESPPTTPASASAIDDPSSRADAPWLRQFRLPKAVVSLRALL
eukprot:TRINITY_DN19516_c0_g2_i1.p1 TRINITY_DN19516_c0_g2~~TRINITY_DN19516_c0_g2_i1.p1  ORF type:complete len:233 (+),score=32.75 TRINITY_DN19516_c0_g2_i1:66-764(+)